jgi:HK97 gp10 family phage protein
MGFTITIANADKLTARLKALGSSKATTKFRGVAAVGCAILQKHMVDSIKAAPTKHLLYKKGKNNTIEHWSSIPYLPPNIDLGGLVGSMIIDKTESIPFAFLRVTAKYARWLEYGTKKADGSDKMLPRRFLAPAVEKNRERIMQLFQKAIDKMIADFNEGKGLST